MITYAHSIVAMKQWNKWGSCYSIFSFSVSETTFIIITYANSIVAMKQWNKWGSCYSIFSFSVSETTFIMITFAHSIVAMIQWNKWGSCYSIFSFICMLCRSLFVLLTFFFWPLCCLFVFDIRNLITPLVSSNSSCITTYIQSHIFKLIKVD